MITLSAVVRDSGPTALILLFAKITFGGDEVGGGGGLRSPREHGPGSLSSAELSNPPPSLGLPHPKI